ncbi:MAG: glycosyltransferase family 39 protein [bacterium]|nr:glycosyltransferase family 39 protein [bacterium]
MNVKSTRVAFWALAALSAVILLPTLLYPHGRDQGMFAYAGRLVLDGAVPFRDFWDTKPPGIYYLYALSEILFGGSMASIRILDLAAQVATAAVIFPIALRVSAGRAGAAFAAGLIYVLAFASTGWWHTAQPDAFLNLPAALAVLIVLRSLDDARPLPLFGAGLLLAVVFLLKYPMGVMLPLLAAGLLAARGRRAVPGVASMLAGFALAAGGYALRLRGAGAWDEFLYTSFVWVRHYARVGAAAPGIAGALRLRELAVSHWSIAALALLSAIGAAFARPRREAAAALVALWALAALFNLFLQAKFFLYHYSPLFPPLAIAASAAAVLPFDRARRSVARAAAATAVICAAVASLLAVNRPYNFYCIAVYRAAARALAARVVSGRVPGDYYMNIRFTSDDFSLPADLAAASYLARRTGPDDRLFIWGNETLVYRLAGRRCGSRFIHNLPFRCDWTPPRFGDALLEELRETTPAYILVARGDPLWWVTGTMEDSLAALRRWPAIERHIADGYAFEAAIGRFLVFRRAGGGPRR